jgi:undecaprenyl-diphosphatase
LAARGAAVVSAAAVVLLAEAAARGNGVTRVDPRVAGEVVHDRAPVLTTLAHLLTFLGSEVVVGVLGISLMLGFLARRRVLQAAAVAVAMAGSVTWIVVLKALVGRARPGAVDRLGPVDHSYSFPSGHTLDSAVLLGLVLVLLVPLIGRAPYRWLAGLAAVVLAVAIGLSRLYLGYHWATDVTASWLLAFAWLTLVHTVYVGVGRRLDSAHRQPG